MTQTSPTRSRTYLLVLVIVRTYMLGALAISFGHIVTASHLLQLDGWPAWTVPFAVDGMAVLGLIGRSTRFEASTRRTGLKLQIGAGVVSLACNVYAGHTIGERIYGALIVVLFVVAEWYASKLAPAPAREQVARDEAHAKRSAAATKAAATRRRNADLASKAERAEARRIRAATRAMEAQVA